MKLQLILVLLLQIGCQGQKDSSSVNVGGIHDLEKKEQNCDNGESLKKRKDEVVDLSSNKAEEGCKLE